MSQDIVVVAEHSDGQIKPVTWEIISFAKLLQRHGLSKHIQVVLLADKVKKAAEELANRSGLDVVALQIRDMATYNGELYTQALSEYLGEFPPSFVCIAHTSQGLDFGPALSVKLNAACLTGVGEVIEHNGGICFGRPVHGGKIIARLKPMSETSVLAVQPGMFEVDNHTPKTSGRIAIRTVSVGRNRSRSLGIKQAEADTTGIAEASVIVAAGMGIGENENLDLIYQLAGIFDKSAVAGSRIVCDMDWLKYSCQVGVTGATVSPQLYIACGISGAVQHVMGMHNSDFIVAINKDPSAAIFQVADICIIDDLMAFIPEFIKTYNEASSVLG